MFVMAFLWAGTAQLTAIVRDIRRATNAGCERVVIDLVETEAARKQAFCVHYYHVAVTPDSAL